MEKQEAGKYSTVGRQMEISERREKKRQHSTLTACMYAPHYGHVYTT